jgi:hypothetical protein
MRLIISADANVATLLASYTPFDTLGEMVDALHGLTTYDDRRLVRLSEEPEICELRFERENGTITLEVCRRASEQHRLCRTLLKATGSVSEVCLPFWRALRSLQTRFSEEEFELRWKRPFPASGMERLSANFRRMRDR